MSKWKGTPRVAAMQVWRTDTDGLYAVVKVEREWVWCRRARGYRPETRYGASFQVHPAHFRRWDLVTDAGPTLTTATGGNQQ